MYIVAVNAVIRPFFRTRKSIYYCFKFKNNRENYSDRSMVIVLLASIQNLHHLTI